MQKPQPGGRSFIALYRACGTACEMQAFSQTRQDSSMPAWIIPALKAILPHLGTILSAAAPVFTKKSADAAANQAMLLQQQITELQTAVSRNDTHIKELAAQIQNTVETLEQGVSLAESRHHWLLVFCIMATVLSVTALCAALYMLLVR
jgi:hypothetical protein